MLHKFYRLNKNQDIVRVVRRGRNNGVGALNIKTLPNYQNHSRITVVVGLKISKKATERNRLKRLVRESVRVFLPRIRPGFDIVIFPRQTLMGQPLATVNSAVETVLKSARIM